MPRIRTAALEACRAAMVGGLVHRAWSIAAEAAWWLDGDELVEIEVHDRLQGLAGGSVAGRFGQRRRRTPGLPREGMALLAGMSATWYTRIEQGRDVSMSPAAASGLARTLKLGHIARRHQFALAGLADAARPDSSTGGCPAALAASVAVIEGPAYVLDAHWTARAWNGAAAAPFTDWLGGSDQLTLTPPASDPGCKLVVLLDPSFAEAPGRSSPPC